MGSEQGWRRLFEAAFERSSSAMELLDSERRILAVNDPFCALAGRPRDELVGRLLDDLVAHEYLLGVDAAWEEFLESGTWLGAWAVVRPDGRRVTSNVAGVLADVDGERRALFVHLEHDPAEEQEAAPGTAGELSGREREVVNLVARGHTTADIAGQMVLSQATIRTHVRNAMAKVGAHTRAHLVALALTGNGILE
jgi:PAS domain S-box-containing protein